LKAAPLLLMLAKCYAFSHPQFAGINALVYFSTSVFRQVRALPVAYHAFARSDKPQNNMKHRVSPPV